MTKSSLRQAAERLVPPAALNAVKSAVGYRLFYRQTFTLTSGVRIEVRSHPDWFVYNEIFADGEYDRAITDAVADAPEGRPFRALDLGANLGFFTLRVVDLLRRQRPGLGLEMVAVEATPSTFKTFARRLRQNGLTGEVRAVCGLVGERSGSAAFSSYPSTTTNSMFHENHAARQVAFVDLEGLVPDGDVDLIKCDIEGAELLFLDAYPGLLARTRRVAIEIHSALVDADACRARLASAGLTRVHDGGGGDCPTELWARKG